MKPKREPRHRYTRDSIVNGLDYVPPDFRNALNRDGIRYEHYFVSADGRVGSNNSCRVGRETVRKFHLLRQNGNPYASINCRVNGVSRGEQVHVLVALSWIGMPPNPRMQVNHKDTIKKNNHVLNLEWTTAKGNSDHAKKHGLLRAGETTYNAKLERGDVRKIQVMYAFGYTQDRLALLFGISQSSVSLIILGLSWRHCELFRKDNDTSLRPSSC